jgi:hypothetical protein
MIKNQTSILFFSIINNYYKNIDNGLVTNRVVIIDAIRFVLQSLGGLEASKDEEKERN